MPFKIFAVEEVLASADVNNYLMKQALITCTSGTRPASPNKGMAILETDTDRFMVHDGATWREVTVINPPRGLVVRNSTQSISTGVQITITWQEARYSFRNVWNAGSPTRLTVPTGMDGIYAVGAALEYDPNGTGTRQVILMKNGAIIGRFAGNNAGTGPATRVVFSREIGASAGDYFEVAAFQNSGVTLNINVVQETPAFWLRRVGSLV
jgi:hypothetical protein